MKFTKENVIKIFGEYMDFEDEVMLYHDDFVLEIMNMDDVDVEEENGMKKDKEWLKDKIKDEELDLKYVYDNYVPYEKVLIADDVHDSINQLDEPEKQVIPKFVADWMKENHGYNIYGALSAVDKETHSQVHDWVFVKGGINDFTRAWLDGFTIANEEKEQKYILSISITDKASKTNYETFLNKRGIFHSMENDSFNSDEFNWTEEEIKCLENGEILFEHFATKVEELEE